MMNMKCKMGKIQELVKYKVRKRVVQWVLALMVPYLLVMVLHLAVPMLFIVGSNEKVQTTYNQYRQESQEVAFHSRALLIANFLHNQFETLKNIRDMQVNLLNFKVTKYININTSRIVINYAGDMKMKTPVSKMLNSSMWYASNISSQQQMSSLQYNTLNRYKLIEKFIKSTLFQNDSRSMPKLKITLSEEKIFFAYPSYYAKQFQEPYYNVFDNQYNKTIQHYKQTGEQYTIIKDHDKFSWCTVLIDNTTVKQLYGTFCYEISSKILAEQLIEIVDNNVEHSYTNFYLMIPIYYHNIKQAQILFNFSDRNPLEVNYQNGWYIKIRDLIRNYFTTNYTYQIMFRQFSTELEYVVLPITIQQTVSKRQATILQLLMVHHFEKTTLPPLNNLLDILLVLFIPTTILVLVFFAIIVASVRYLLFNLEQEITVLNVHCSHILKGQLNAVIPSQDQSGQLWEIFYLYGILNKLYQISSQDFYKGTSRQILIKYKNVNKTFEQLSYNTCQVTEIIGNCYYNLNQYKNAAQYYQISFFQQVSQLQKQYGQLEGIILNKAKYKAQTKKFDIQYQFLKRKLLKLIMMKLWPTVKKEDQFSLRKLFDLYRKLCFKERISNDQFYVRLMEIRFKFETKQLSDIDNHLRLLQMMLKKLEKVQRRTTYKQEMKYRHNPMKQVYHPIQIYKQILTGIKGQTLMLNGQYAAAARKLVNSMENQQICRPFVVNRTASLLKNIFMQFDLFQPRISHTIYFQGIKNIQERQIFMIFEWSGANFMSAEQSKQWKKNAVGLAKEIFLNELNRNDRLSVIRFDYLPEIICPLTTIKSYKRLILSSINELLHTKTERLNSNIVQTLVHLVDRSHKLKQEKYLIFFIQSGTHICSEQIDPILQKLPKRYHIYFLQFGLELNGDLSPNYYLIQASDKDSFRRLFSRKDDVTFNRSNPF